MAPEPDDKGRRRDVRRPKLSHVLAEYLGVTGDGGCVSHCPTLQPSNEPAVSQQPFSGYRIFHHRLSDTMIS